MLILKQEIFSFKPETRIVWIPIATAIIITAIIKIPYTQKWIVKKSDALYEYIKYVLTHFEEAVLLRIKDWVEDKLLYVLIVTAIGIVGWLTLGPAITKFINNIEQFKDWAKWVGAIPIKDTPSIKSAINPLPLTWAMFGLGTFNKAMFALFGTLFTGRLVFLNEITKPIALVLLIQIITVRHFVRPAMKDFAQKVREEKQEARITQLEKHMEKQDETR